MWSLSRFAFFYWMSWCHSLCVYEYFYFGWTLFMVCYTLIEFRVMWSFSRCSWLLLHWLIGCVIWYIILLLLMATFTLIECLCYLAIHFLCKACSAVVACVIWSFIHCARLALLWLCFMVIHLLCKACSVVVACVVWSSICCARLALLWLLVFNGHSFVVQGLLCGGCLCCMVIHLLCKACSVVVACVVWSFPWCSLFVLCRPETWSFLWVPRPTLGGMPRYWSTQQRFDILFILLILLLQNKQIYWC